MKNKFTAFRNACAVPFLTVAAIFTSRHQPLGADHCSGSVAFVDCGGGADFLCEEDCQAKLENCDTNCLDICPPFEYNGSDSGYSVECHSVGPLQWVGEIYCNCEGS